MTFEFLLTAAECPDCRVQGNDINFSRALEFEQVLGNVGKHAGVAREGNKAPVLGGVIYHADAQFGALCLGKPRPPIFQMDVAL